MKTRFTFLTAILIIFSLSTNATVWRVNNRPNVDADFTTLNAAYLGAESFDTIYLEGSPFNYGDNTFYKPLTVIGAGYWLIENDSTQSYKETSKVGQLKFYAGSEGSVIEGLQIQHHYVYGGLAVDIRTNNITLRRNYISAWSNYNNYGSIGIQLYGALNTLTIEQNWIQTVALGENYAICILLNNYVSSSLIRNNILYCDTNQLAIHMAVENEAASLIISNNVIMGKINTYYSSHYNNIILWGTYTAGTGDINSNNLCDETQYPNINGNQQNVDMTTVFEDYTTYIDNGYLLKPGSPAIGAGILGVDCGAFGTNNPYVLSGMPPIPAIFETEMTQSIGNTTLPVTIKAKSHN